MPWAIILAVSRSKDDRMWRSALIWKLPLRITSVTCRSMVNKASRSTPKSFTELPNRTDTPATFRLRLQYRLSLVVPVCQTILSNTYWAWARRQTFKEIHRMDISQPTHTAQVTDVGWPSVDSHTLLKSLTHWCRLTISGPCTFKSLMSVGHQWATHVDQVSDTIKSVLRVVVSLENLQSQSIGFNSRWIP